MGGGVGRAGGPGAFSVGGGMDYREYQKYLADGGWMAVSTHNAVLTHLTAQVNALAERVEVQGAELARLRRDELVGSGFVARSLAVVGYWLAGVGLVSVAVGVVAWVSGFLG